MSKLPMESHQAETWQGEREGGDGWLHLELKIGIKFLISPSPSGVVDEIGGQPWVETGCPVGREPVGACPFPRAHRARRLPWASGLPEAGRRPLCSGGVGRRGLLRGGKLPLTAAAFQEATP